MILELPILQSQFPDCRPPCNGGTNGTSTHSMLYGHKGSSFKVGMESTFDFSQVPI
jgi:hypothetical protein